MAEDTPGEAANKDPLVHLMGTDKSVRSYVFSP